jgi:hypothetical protein
MGVNFNQLGLKFFNSQFSVARTFPSVHVWATDIARTLSCKAQENRVDSTASKSTKIKYANAKQVISVLPAQPTSPYHGQAYVDEQQWRKECKETSHRV